MTAIRAVDVMAEAVIKDGSELVAALLAHGSEYGVVILPDGTLRGLKPVEAIADGHAEWLYRLTEPGEPT